MELPFSITFMMIMITPPSSKYQSFHQSSSIIKNPNKHQVIILLVHTHIMRRQRPSSAKSSVINLDSSSSDVDQEVISIDSSSCSDDEHHDDVRQMKNKHKGSAASAPTLKPNKNNNATSSSSKPDDKIFIDPSQPEKGWFLHGKIPSHLKISDREAGFNHLLKDCLPEEPGKVMMFGKMVDVPRFQQAYLADYVFTGSCSYAKPKMDPVCEELLEWCNQQLMAEHTSSTSSWLPSETDVDGCTETFSLQKREMLKKEIRENIPVKNYRFNSALLNWYLEGNHYMGPHSDDESALHPLSPIFSLSLGQTRVFRFRERTKERKIVKDIELKNLDYVVMGGAIQKNYLHEIVKVNGKKGKMLFGPRVNVTFRCFKKPMMA